jgi:hypothetical protein
MQRLALVVALAALSLSGCHGSDLRVGAGHTFNDFRFRGSGGFDGKHEEAFGSFSGEQDDSTSVWLELGFQLSPSSVVLKREIAATYTARRFEDLDPIIRVQVPPAPVPAPPPAVVAPEPGPPIPAAILSRDAPVGHLAQCRALAEDLVVKMDRLEARLAEPVLGPEDEEFDWRGALWGGGGTGGLLGAAYLLLMILRRRQAAHAAEEVVP